MAEVWDRSVFRLVALGSVFQKNLVAPRPPRKAVLPPASLHSTRLGADWPERPPLWYHPQLPAGWVRATTREYQRTGGAPRRSSLLPGTGPDWGLPASTAGEGPCIPYVSGELPEQLDTGTLKNRREAAYGVVSGEAACGLAVTSHDHRKLGDAFLCVPAASRRTFLTTSC